MNKKKQDKSISAEEYIRLWEYRIVKKSELLFIYEIYYGAFGDINGYNTVPEPLQGESIRDLKTKLRQYTDALKKPILDYEELAVSQALNLHHDDKGILLNTFIVDEARDAMIGGYFIRETSTAIAGAGNILLAKCICKDQYNIHGIRFNYDAHEEFSIDVLYNEKTYYAHIFSLDRVIDHLNYIETHFSNDLQWLYRAGLIVMEDIHVRQIIKVINDLSGKFQIVSHLPHYTFNEYQYHQDWDDFDLQFLRSTYWIPPLIAAEIDGEDKVLSYSVEADKLDYDDLREVVGDKLVITFKGHSSIKQLVIPDKISSEQQSMKVDILTSDNRTIELYFYTIDEVKNKLTNDQRTFAYFFMPRVVIVKKLPNLNNIARIILDIEYIDGPTINNI